jgi:GAF domain-containing protein
MTLYVATYHLHAALDPAGVEAAIAEIAVDLLGARRFVLLLEEEDGTCRVAMDRTAGHRGDHGGREGREGESAALFADRRYAGGDPMIDATLADGVLRMTAVDDGADDEDATLDAGAAVTRPRGPVATVPLNLGGHTAGVLAILELFPHKRGLTTEDRDLLDLLAAHAASALTAAQLFSVSERKLRTYRSLIELARR